MDIKKQKLDKFLTEYIGEDYTNSQNKQAFLDKMYNNPNDLKNFLLQSSPDLYADDSGDVEKMVGAMSNVSMGEMAKDIIPNAIASTLKGAAGVASIVDPDIAKSDFVKGLNDMSQYNTPNFGEGDTLKSNAFGAGTSAAQMLGYIGGSTILAGALASNPEAAIPLASSLSVGAMAATSGGNKALEHLEQGGGRTGAALTGAAYAAATFAFNKIFKPIDTLFGLSSVKEGVKKSLIRKTASYMNKELSERTANELANIFTDKLEHHISGVGKDVSLKDAAKRMKDTIITTLMAGPIISAGSRLITPTLHQKAMQWKIDEPKRIAAQADEVSSKLEEMAQTGEAELVSKVSQVYDKATGDVKQVLQPVENMNRLNETFTQTPEGKLKPIRTIQIGDKVFVKGKTKKLDSGVFNSTGAPIEARVMSKDSSSGRLKVKLNSKNSPIVDVHVSQIVDRYDKTMPSATKNLEIGENAPKFSQSLRFGEKLMKGIKHLYKAKNIKGSYASIQVRDPKKGDIYRLNMDKALKLYPDAANFTLVHEIGHIINNISNKGFPKALKGRWLRGFKAKPEIVFLDRLVGGFTSMKKSVLKHPLQKVDPEIFNKSVEELNQHIANLESQGKDIGALHEDIGAEWDKIVAKNFNNKKVKTLSSLRAEALEEVGKTSKLDPLSPAYQEEVNKVLDKKIKHAEKKGVLLSKEDYVEVPKLMSELFTVSAVARGLNPNDPKAIKSIASGGYGPPVEEAFADFFSMKILHATTEVGNQPVKVIDAYAPNLGKIYDEYLMLDKNFAKALQEALTVDEDSLNKEVAEAILEMKEQDILHAKTMDEKNQANKMWNRGMKGNAQFFWQGMANAYYIPYTTIKEYDTKTGGKNAPKFREAMEQLYGISAGTQAFISEMEQMQTPMFELIKKEYPDADPEGLLGYWMALKRVATGGRKKHFETMIEVYDPDTDTYKNEVIQRTYDIHTNPKVASSAEEAQAKLDTFEPFVKNKEAFEKFANSYMRLWNEQILSALEESGIINTGLRQFFEKEMPFYATFHIQKEVDFDNEVVGEIAPQLKRQTGSTDPFINPIGATMEKGMNLMWLARINDAKRKMINYLPPELVEQKKKVNGKFRKPRDKRKALVVFKDKGKDFGYWVPSDFVAGFEYDGLNKFGAVGELLNALRATNPFFRNLYTTYNPGFTPNNMKKDATRLWVNSVDFENGGYGSGIMVPWGESLIQSFRAFLGDEKINKALLKEEHEMLQQEVVLSDYSFSMRDASDPSLSNRIKATSLAGKERKEVELRRQQASLMGRILGSFVGRPIVALKDFAHRSNREIEMAAKRAAFRYYKSAFKKGLITRAEYNHLVRTAGSPNFLNKGSFHPLIGALSIFYNPKMQGLSEDIEMMSKHPKVMQKRLLLTSMSLALQSAIPVALIRYLYGNDKELAEQNPYLSQFIQAFRNIPHKHVEQGFNIPLALTPDGQTAYLFMPHDETTQLFKQTALKIFKDFMNPTIDNTLGIGAPSIQMLSASENPIIESFTDFFDVAKGVNPPDPFIPNKGVIPEKIWNTHSWPKYWGLMKFFYNKLAPTSGIIKLRETRDGEFLNMKPKDRLQWVAQKLEQAYHIPGLEMFIRLGGLRISAQGRIDETKDILEPIEAYKARWSLLKDRIINKALSDDKDAFNSAIRDIGKFIDNAGKDPAKLKVAKDAVNSMTIEMKKAAQEKGLSPQARIFLGKTEAEKIALLQSGQFNL